MNPSKEANCCVLGDGSNAADHSHVSMVTPFQTKKKEIMNDPQYKNEAMSKSREKSVTAARRGGNVRPLDGGVAQ
jgi:hypothetical protein